MPAPHIVVDLIGLQTPSATRGIGRYTRGLALALYEAAPGLVAFWIDPALPPPDLPPGLPRVGSPWTGRWRLVSSPFEPSRLPLTKGSADLAAIVYDRTPARFPDWCLPTPERVTHYRAQTDAVLACDRLLAISESAADEFRKAGARDVRVIGAGVDVPATEPDIQNEARDRSLIVSSLERHKNLDVILEAAQLRPALRFLVAGSAPDHLFDALQARIDQAGLREQFLLRRSPSDACLAGYYRHCAALIAPSLWEGLDLPVLEARAQGAPVIVSDIAAHREVLGSDHSALFDPRRADQLVAQIEAYSKLATAMTRSGVDPIVTRRPCLDRGCWSWSAVARRTLEALG